ncbi:phage tail protein [Salmonella enterica subsp. diarizonae]|uniref:Phage tail protein n=1 Tax=Salmonella enterica TaxID=28901 RepID=A0A5T7Y3U1_SALER|nr:phage tail protein [Salmonella enterica]ECF6107347.1 phage tail protein [Salmonella enterica subsp. diarizonae]ECI4401579.1 phage tail protein [Salmonella enterica subsp. diarizonae]ECJ2501768.1 phage tail protein [Salmonella enterica subsp. diarizonae]EDQ4583206.1 phage tail protein [Salmonella enterica subsp. diarizonae]
MSAGTLTLTNNADTVTGSGTAFITELAAGDFIVVTVGGVPYTLPVKTVNSNISLTLVSVYTGPTQSGAAWYAVPRMALNMVTAALVAQSAEALRGLNYDKQNWQNIFSGAGSVTVTLPDGSTWAGPSWSGIATTIDGKLDKTKNLNDLYDKKQSRINLGLGSAAILDAGTSTGNVIQVGGFGVGTFTPEAVGGNSTKYAYDLIGKPPGIYRTNTANTPDALGCNGVLEKYSYNSTFSTLFFITTDTISPKAFMQQASDSTFSEWAEFYTTINTTRASDGTIKVASPVVKIYSDGRYETNNESEGVSVLRRGIGEYLVSGCTGLNSDAAWGGIDGGFEIPVDRNKQTRIWLDYVVNSDGSILVKTYHRVHKSAPSFAQNRIGRTDINGVFTETVADGEPVDVPADSFVLVRVEMPVDSIWNKKQEAIRIAMEEARMKEEQRRSPVARN